MRRYLYNYRTSIQFSSQVCRHFFKLRCLPCDNACQWVVRHSFSVHTADYIAFDKDVWGNSVQYGSRMDWQDSFDFVSSGEVRLQPYSIHENEVSDIFRLQSALTRISPEMKEFAEMTSCRTVLERAVDYSHRIFEYMCYSPGVTNPRTTAADAFVQRSGVCQDYAHILIALCRANGIPARYVDGFIQGEGETHAWVEVYDKGAWWGIDPTNDVFIEYGYIKLSHGRDANDCPVNRGVFTGTAMQNTSIQVVVNEI